MIYLNTRRLASCLCFLFWLLSSLELKAQYFNKSIDLNQTSNTGITIIPVDDGLLISVGSVCVLETTFVSCVGLLKTDFDGNVVWTRIIEGFKTPTANSMIVDGDYIYLAIRHNIAPLANIKILKLDMAGNTLEEWDLGATQENENPFGLLRYKEGFIIYSLLFPPDHEEIAWLIFTDSVFTPVHEVFFDEEDPAYGLIVSRDLTEVSDGNLIATCRSGSVGFAVGNITKFDSLGQVIWQQLLPLSESGSGTHEVHVVELQDGGFAVNGFRDQSWSSGNYEYPPTVFKLDADGEILWEYTFITPLYDRKRINNLHLAANGDIIGEGYRKFYRDDLERYVDCGWMFRLDPESGAVVWDRTLCDYRSPLYSMTFWDGVELPNGDLVFTGLYQDTFPNAMPFINDPNVWLVRLSAEGCLVEGCNEWTIVNPDGSITATEEALPINGRFVVYPNPGNGQVWIAAEGESLTGQRCRVMLYDAQGRPAKEENFQAGRPQPFDWGDLPPGMYYYLIRSEDGEAQSGKLAIIR
ncbi:MAG: T9SS type A sorting domain-containing protein [Saprospiraceae bacterium]|nr:T9SS type A sorting domain-containing protein [Saprospiraceae bacterium]